MRLRRWIVGASLAWIDIFRAWAGELGGSPAPSS
jgi:hypothetical protein